MSDYGFVHEGHVYTPNRTSGIAPDINDDRNKAIERAELDAWKTKPDRQLAYYDDKARTVGTWLGTVIGQITSFTVHRHNFGGRVCTMRVHGSNGATYYGRASYDNGTCVVLRRARS